MGLFQGDFQRACVGCEHFAEWRANGAVILCMREERPYAQATPESGCAFWVRAIGADDEQAPERRQTGPRARITRAARELGELRMMTAGDIEANMTQLEDELIRRL